MQLKKYQKAALKTLRTFLEKTRETSSAKSAFEVATKNIQLGKYQSAYFPLKNLPDVPYACIRIPTGGGKTILASHTIKMASHSYLERDFPVAIWFVPSKAIREQTLKALKNPAHPYRQVLDDEFDGRVRVFDISEFAQVRPIDFKGSACIIISTIQTLRISNTEGRKVYAHNEHLEAHFAAIPNVQAIDGLEKDESGKVKFSFANLLYLYNPLMIVDEAHNAVTGLTRDMQERINPACIIEYTATPKPRSNVLFSVSASALKNEDMIKLPIKLSTHKSWQASVSGAISEREILAKEALNDKQYIRPIVLFQAQNKDQEVTAEILKQHLIENEQVAEEKIAVVTGNQQELDGIDLFDPKCPIDYVITVKALKEGWDCSFAYVFCSVANIKSSTDVEQLLGRVLRMPYATKRSSEALNKAYAHICEPNFIKAATELKDALVEGLGFAAEEVDDNLQAPQLELNDSLEETEVPAVEFELEAFDQGLLDESVKDKVTIEKTSAGHTKVTVSEALNDIEQEILMQAIAKKQQKDIKKQLDYQKQVKQRLDSPALQGKAFKVPRLSLEYQGELDLLDHDLPLEIGGWSLLDFSAELTISEFNAEETVVTTEHDVDKGVYKWQVQQEEATYQLAGLTTEWDEKLLVLWLDKEVRDKSISQLVRIEFIRQVVDLQRKDYSLAQLVRAKYRLAKAIREKIKQHYLSAKEQCFQQYLFNDPEVVVSSADNQFDFDFPVNAYPATKVYRGAYQFQKHYYGNHRVGELKDSGEEAECAMLIDRLPEVEFWVRNLENRKESSFKIAKATGWFYPDFVVKLTDGRIFVVEYKGAHLINDPDTKQKELVGKLWEEKSNGRGIFLMAEKIKNGLSLQDQLKKKVG
ncbi:DEAD/DEAH box helicase [Kangiella sp. TOML190]|uniref:DEAD/DEAH box helicase n=1 Tax=Kangiella sp. TOML190 TaxID=2931351 RepID=UPI00203D1C6D|nr:DEAD/DEAH box helicase family protein [Kangiella sp. TOML190]